MPNQYYKVTTTKGKIFYAEVPQDKKMPGGSSLDKQLGVWYENIEGSKYRGNGIEVVKVKEVPSTGVNWLSFYSDYLESKPFKKSKQEA